MSVSQADAIAAAWERGGARCAARVESSSGAVVVLGAERDATAAVALGLARALGARQRVAIADLLGDAPLLQWLSDELHAPGISDSFVHGVSLNEVARPVRGEPQLFVLAAGRGEVATPQILGSKRWERLAKGFREVGARLVLAVRADAEGAEALAQRLGGAVVVGPDLLLGPDVPTLAVAMLDLEVAGAATEVAGAATGGVASTPVATTRSVTPVEAPIWSPSRRHLGDGRRIAVLLGLGAVSIAVAAVLWRSADDAPAPLVRQTDSVAASDSVPTAIPPANPEDSARSSRFAVELMAANTLEGARLALVERLPAGTVAPATFGAARVLWFRVVAGAFGSRREADSLLAALVRARRLPAGAGRVVELPLAFVVQEGVARDSASIITNQWIQQGVPAYPLVQDDGRVTIFAGAFERLDWGTPLVPALAAARLAPVTAYRLGRMF